MIIIDSRATAYFLGRCTPCVRPVRTHNTDATGRYLHVPCPECGEPVTAERLHTADSIAPCDGRCMGAVGPRCECSCEGENHGKSWSALTVDTDEWRESALARYRANVAAREEAARRRRERQRAEKEAAFARWCDENRDVAEYLADPTTYSRPGRPNQFLDDMADHLASAEPLTTNQADAVRRCKAAHERYRAKIAAENAAAKPVPTGEAITIQGTIAYTTIDDNPYGPGARYRMLVTGDGWKVWTTIPATVRNTTWKLSDLHGRAVRFVATVTASRNDPAVGNAKRPRRAELLPSTG